MSRLLVTVAALLLLGFVVYRLVDMLYECIGDVL